MGVRWKQFGSIWISAGIAITGSLWWVVQSHVVKGEHIALCYAARAERVLAFHIGTNTFQRYIDSEPNSNAIDYVIRQNYYIIGTNFSDTVTCYRASSATSLTRLSSPSNIVVTSANWASPFTFSFTATNRPLGAENPSYYTIKNSAGEIAVITVYASSGNSANGSGDNLDYHYEPTILAVQYFTSGDVTLTRTVAPSGNPEVITNVIPILEPIDQQGSISDHMLWRTLYDNVLCAARDLAVIPLNRHNWVMASTNSMDLNSYDFANVFWLDYRSADLVDGQTILVNNSKWLNTSSNILYVTWDGKDPPIDYDLHVEREWTIASVITGLIDKVATTETRWPLIGMSFQPDMGSTNLPISDAIIDILDFGSGISDGTTKPDATTIAQDNWWKAIDNGTNSYRFWCENVDTNNEVTSLVRWHVTTNLIQSKNIMSNLKRTLYVVPITDMQKISASAWVWHGETNNGPSPIQGTGIAPTFEGDGWWTTIYNSMSVPVSTNEISITENIVTYDLSALEYVYRLWNDPDPETDETYVYTYSASVDYTANQQVMKSKYPSEWACSHSNVVKMRIYGVPFVTPSAPQYASPPHNYSSVDFIATLKGGSIEYQQYDWLLFENYASLVPLPSGITYNDDGADYVDIASASGLAASHEVKLSLIGEWDYPLTQPAFNIGTNILALPPGQATLAQNYSEWELLDSVGVGRQRDIIEQHYWGMTVKCPIIIVEVWWRWDYFGEASYEPTPYTPAWATTNTP